MKTYLSTDTRIRRTKGEVFPAAVGRACMFYKRRFGVLATHCNVHPDEPGIPASWRIGSILIVPAWNVKPGEFEAYRDES